jgi:hypothetical protein
LVKGLVYGVTEPVSERSGCNMVVMDFARSRGERTGTTRTERGAAQRTKALMRTFLEIGATFSVLVLIMIGALTVRMLLSLPFGVAH